jgi:HAD superfamily hydrolase (TIGR01509 family)
MRKNYKAILWDCDGVLIDSEYIACGISAAFFTRHGYPITTEKFIERFMGKGRSQIFREIEEESGLVLSSDNNKGEARRQLWEAFKNELKGCEGIADVLRQIKLPMAVASGSDLERLTYSLGLTGLTDYFKGHIYSSEQLAKGKPSPDIFLHAAEKLGVAPEDCLVVEDGIHGIHAAQAAGMDVLVYTGATHMSAELREKVLAQKPMGELTHIAQLLDYLGEKIAA